MFANSDAPLKSLEILATMAHFQAWPCDMLGGCCWLARLSAVQVRKIAVAQMLFFSKGKCYPSKPGTAKKAFPRNARVALHRGAGNAHPGQIVTYTPPPPDYS